MVHTAVQSRGRNKHQQCLACEVHPGNKSIKVLRVVPMCSQSWAPQLFTNVLALINFPATPRTCNNKSFNWQNYSRHSMPSKIPHFLRVPLGILKRHESSSWRSHRCSPSQLNLQLPHALRTPTRWDLLQLQQGPTQPSGSGTLFLAPFLSAGKILLCWTSSSLAALQNAHTVAPQCL